MITSRVLAQISKHHIAVVICDNKYLPTGIYLELGQYHRAAKRAMWQSKWTELERLNAWTEVVRQKICNQINLAIYFELDQDRISLMKDLLDDLTLGDSTNREGHIAKVYFNTLYGQGFSRDDENIINHCMDYGYAIIRAQMARAVSSLGLIPSLGIFHKNEYNSFNLVDDLMEPFRPLMDYYINQFILNNCQDYLSYETRLKLISFLNERILIKGKKIFMNQAINDFVNSFIKAMEEDDFSKLLRIDINSYIGCDKK